MHIPFFRIFYSTTFTILSLLLAALLLITPIDQTRQAFRNRQFYNIFIIAGSHLLTLLVAIFLYASRLFNNRSVLASIPRPWSPVENGDIGKRVRRLIAAGLKKSAIIAYEAHPRDLSHDKAPDEEDQSPSSNDGVGDRPNATNRKPVWGIISHPGWSPPSSPDLPNLHYDPVINELAHLIEAKAVSLAPVDPLSISTSTEPPPADPVAVELLQRPATMNLRDYVCHLTSLGIINPSSLGNDLLAIYEKARFSNRPLDEAEFRAMMHVFAAILREMTPLHPDIITEVRADDDTMSNLSSPLSTDDQSSLHSNATVEYTPRPNTDVSPNGSPTSSYRSQSRSPSTARRNPNRRAKRSGSASRWDGFRTPSVASLKPVRSTTLSARSHESSGSVIRLAEARGPLDLPYTILDASGQPI
jgi:hypothetical protein